jgi:hypothetical protein
MLSTLIKEKAMHHIDPKTFSPFAPEYVEPDRPHGAVNAFGEWEWEMLETKHGLPKVYATLWRDPYSVYATNSRSGVEVKTTLTTPCPFCRQQHEHGIGDGHRQPHCATNKAKASVSLSDGTTVYQKDGYIVRTRLTPKNQKQ